MKQTTGPIAKAFTLLLGGCFSQPLQVIEAEGSGATSSQTSASEEATSTSDAAIDTTAAPHATIDGPEIDGSDTADTATDSECGNGVVDAGEECDTIDIMASTCRALGFDGGSLSCGAECSYDTSHCVHLPDPPVLTLSFSQIKQFDFGWAAGEAEHYQLFESAVPGDPFVQIGEDLIGESVSFTMPLHFRAQASYFLRACNDVGCTDSEPVSVMASLAGAVGYLKAPNTGENDFFGYAIALSADGHTLAVGARFEDSGSLGIDGDATNDAAPNAGAVYVFVCDSANQWSQEVYIKASNAGAGDEFGLNVALSGDGNTLAVGAWLEDSNATGANGDGVDDSAPDAGAIYVFARSPMGQWSQQAYLKSSNAEAYDYLGSSVALSSDGNTLVAGAYGEDSNAIGIDGDQADNSASFAGAAYVFARDSANQWSQQAYLKASNTDAGDDFSNSLALSGDGNTLAVGAFGEGSTATGIGGDQYDNSATSAGAVYVFARDSVNQWSQQAYLKASNSGADDRFGNSVALSGDTLAVGASQEDSSAVGVGGDQGNDAAPLAGAVYVFSRDLAEQWSQQAYLKASNTASVDRFGYPVALSSDGHTLAVAAYYEDSNAIGIGGNQVDNSAIDAGAVYVFVRDPMDQWSQRAYIKASNTGPYDYFGYSSLALSGDGTTLAVGAHGEDSSATNIAGDQANETSPNSGAVYLF